ncbi:MAG: nucleotidyltransferase family protein [Acidimicrobiia bacterium]|nr:nucleotidyltransferase family protein [Acidimicrobiia bacterium]MBT8217149.1 nucleotidyltransferase family protein [Acidimicrobiia bacterium]NNF10647.1 nucleotidyltransferase family protein [Acidimicrobiia bacterium]NNL71606.1 nucleotidyltransferase family protein [Acidimicrobiia bacterium]
MTRHIAGIVVAAGGSTRMGEPKQLIEVHGRPMLQWVIDAAAASRLGRVVIVVAPDSGELRAAVTGGRATFVINPDPATGTMSSFRTGVAAAGPAAGYVKLLADQPEVTPADIDALIDGWDPAAHSGAVASYRGEDGHPLLVGGDALRSVIDEDGDRLLWQLLMDGEPARVEIDRLRPIDVNTPADLAALRERLAQRPPAPPTA